MANKYLDDNGLLYLWQKIKGKLDDKVDKEEGKGLVTVDATLSSTSTNPVQNKAINTALGNKVDKVEGKGLSTNDFTADYKTKLDGIASGATKTTIDSALSSTSTNPVQNKVINTALAGKAASSHTHTIAQVTDLQSTLDGKAASSHTHTIEQVSDLQTALDGKASTAVATTTANGLMSSTDKSKLDGIVAGANKTTVDSSLSSTSTNPVQNKVINSALAGKAASSHAHTIAQVTNLQTTLDGKASTDVATQSANGLMSSADKTKLDGISSSATENRLAEIEGDITSLETTVGGKVDKVDGKGLSTEDFTSDFKTKLEGIATGANKITVDSALNSTSTNPVQNKVINTALGNKVDKVSGKGLSTNDFTAAYKTKLDGIAEGATNITVDEALSSTSTNPVQNKVINTALAGKASTAAATTSAAGLMSSSDKYKLDGIASGANKTVVDTALSSTSTNPVQNKVLNTLFGNKVDKVSGKGLSTKDFTAAYETKLSDLYTKADLDTKFSNYATKSDITGLFSFKGSVGGVPPLTQYTFGSVFNLSVEFTTDADFVEGAGKTYPAGTNIVIVDTDTIGTSPTKKWDVLAGTIDLSAYMKTTDMVAITNAEIDTILAS